MTTTPTDDERDKRVEWPPPAPDPPEEPSHRAGRIVDRDRGDERGDVADDEGRRRLWRR